MNILLFLDRVTSSGIHIPAKPLVVFAGGFYSGRRSLILGLLSVLVYYFVEVLS